ncbi:MAG TPA: hypothetical protein GXZ90_05060 [Clostridiales bacterium]|nr:hypothetical protein [Clostridiales bacterium]
MKFDVIIGNPPYQVMDEGDNKSSATPIYHKFIDLSIDLRPTNMIMIIPSKWMKGGKGLAEFRVRMMNDTRISHLIDFQDSIEIFPSVKISGGVCYFLWNINHEGEVNYTYHAISGEVDKSTRFLNNTVTDNVVRDSRQLSIIEKVTASKNIFFDSIVSPRKPFGLGTNFFSSDKYSHIETYDKYTKGLVAVHHVSGQGYRRDISYIRPDDLPRSHESVEKYKLFFSKAYNYRSTVIPKVILGHPGYVCTETFLKIGDFDTEKEMKNCLTYIKTKFFRALLYYNRHSLSVTRGTFALIPLQDFSKIWTDEKLYEKYKLSDDEINYIESNIKEM